MGSAFVCFFEKANTCFYSVKIVKEEGVPLLSRTSSHSNRSGSVMVAEGLKSMSHTRS